MKWLFFCICLAWLVAAEGEVFVLTDDNFDFTINAGKPVLVKFYAPWCGRCQALIPEYTRLAQEVKNTDVNVVIAELDATVYTTVAAKYEIQSYPTITLFIEGSTIEYKGASTMQSLLEFIQEKLKHASIELKTKEEVEEMANEAGKKCFLISNNEEDLKNFIDTAKTTKYFRFFHTSEEIGKQVFPKVTKPSVVVRRDFSIKELIYTDSFSPEKLRPYLKSLQFDVMTDFNEESAEEIFEIAEKKAVFLIQKGTPDRAANKIFMKFAKAKKSDDFIYLNVNATDNIGKRLAGYFGLTEEELPIVEILDARNQDNARYRFTGKIELSALEDFMEKYLKGEIKRFVKSEPIPESNPGPVYKVVGNTFKQEVIDNDEDVLVKFYTEKCGHCKRLAPIYTEVAEKLKHNANIKFVELEAAKNEVVGMTFVSFPVLYLYPAGKKDQPIKYEEERSEESIMNFLKEKCTNPIELPKSDL